jgi:hypothetical protein
VLFVGIISAEGKIKTKNKNIKTNKTHKKQEVIDLVLET